MDMDTAPEPGPAAMPPPPPPPSRKPAEDGNIRIVDSYAPRLGHAQQAPTMMIDPTTGNKVPISEMSEHMRIQLMDPKWREEKKRMDEKQRDKSGATGEDIAKNLSTFAKQRNDIFGSTEEEESALLEEHRQSKQRQEEAKRIIWDGSSDSMQSCLLYTSPSPRD